MYAQNFSDSDSDFWFISFEYEEIEYLISPKNFG